MKRQPKNRIVGAVLALLIAACCGTASSSPSQPKVQDLATLSDLAGLSVSPDGRWASFQVVRPDLENNRYETAWYVIAVAEPGKTRRLADAGGLFPAGSLRRTQALVPSPPPTWSPDGTWFAVLRRDRESTQVWRVTLDGHSVEQLTHNEGDVRTTAFSRDGLRLLFETDPSQAQLDAALEPEGRSGYLYDRRFDPRFDRRPLIPFDADFAKGTGPTASVLKERKIWVYDFRNNRERLATAAESTEFKGLTAPSLPHETPTSRTPIAVSPTGGLAWTEARDPNQQGYYAPLTLVAQLRSAKKPIVCEAAACNSEMIEWVAWRDDEEILFARREGDQMLDETFYIWRPEGNDLPRLVWRTTGVYTSSGSFQSTGCAAQQRYLVCIVEQSRLPMRLISIDLENGEKRTLYDPNPSFRSLDLGKQPELIKISAGPGVSTYGHLVLPTSHRRGTRLPLVIVTYSCGGFLRGGVGDEYPVYPLVAQGFAVLCYKLPADIERWRRLNAEQYADWAWGPTSPMRRRIEETLSAAINQLDSRGIIDPDRVGLTGLSYGAEIVGHALLHNRRLAAAIASGRPGHAGPSEYALMSIANRESLRARAGLGAPDETPELWRRRAFSLNVHDVQTPLLINVADGEMLQALDPFVALQTAKRAVEMYVFPDEYHVKWQPAHRLAIYTRNIDWMNFWLQGREDSNPAKVDQYTRWRAMRVKQCELFKGADAPWYCRS